MTSTQETTTILLVESVQETTNTVLYNGQQGEKYSYNTDQKGKVQQTILASWEILGTYF